MKIQDLIKKYHKKLTAEGIIKSAVTGLFFGFIAGGLLSALALIFSFNGLWTVWVAAVLALITGVAAGRVSYIRKFRPTFADAAARVDQLGLEERTLTMLELEESETVIAEVQRADGKEKMKTVNPKMMRMRFSARMLVAVAVAVAFGLSVISAAAVSAVQAKGDNDVDIIQPGPGPDIDNPNNTDPTLPPEPLPPVDPGEGDDDDDDDDGPPTNGNKEGTIINPNPDIGLEGLPNGEFIIDGKTPYTDNFEVWAQYFAERMKDPTLTAEARAAAEAYYKILLAICVA